MAWSISSGLLFRARLVIAICLVLAALAYADKRNYGGWHGGGPSGGGNGWGYPGWGDNDNDDNDNNDDDDDDSTTNNGNNGFPGNGQFDGRGFDIGTANRYRNIHGIVATVALVGLFPTGSILMRVLPGKLALWVHAVFQTLALCVYIAAAGLGIYLARMVRIPGGDNLLTAESTRYHPIIGLVILAIFLLQPVIGYVHHKRYKQLLRRQVWSYLHLFNGRIAITVGIINGGLGLQLANASSYRKRVYIIVAAIMWSLWMVVAIVSEILRMRRTRAPPPAKTETRVKGVSEEGRRSED